MIKVRDEIMEILNNNAAKLVEQDAAICTNAIIAAEFSDFNGNYWYAVLKDDNLPIWRNTGFLQYILDNDLNTDENDEESD